MIATILSLFASVSFGRFGSRIAPVAVIFALLAGYLLILGAPPFPPVASTQKLFYLAIILGLLGLILELARPRPVFGIAAICILSLAGLIWLASRSFNPLDSHILSNLIALYGGTVAIQWCVAQADQREGQAAAAPVLASAILTMVGAAALGLTAFFRGAPLVAQLAIVVVSASGGYILVAWLFYLFGKQPPAYGLIGRVGIINVIAAIGYVYVLFADQPDYIAIVIVGLTFATHFIAKPVAARMVSVSGAAGRALRPICYGMIVSVAVVAEVIYVQCLA